MDAYDNNHDGRIDIRELAQLLPLEEGFKLLFKFENQVDSSVEFMKVSSCSPRTSWQVGANPTQSSPTASTPTDQARR